MPYRLYRLVAVVLLTVAGGAVAGEFKHQVTGLFMPGREQDLRDVVAEIPTLKLVAVDFANAEATFEYDPAKAFPGAKPDQVVARLDQLLRGASHGTFGAKPLRTTPLEKLSRVEIEVGGLDCKACSLAAYEAVYKLDGVERATASFRDGKVAALIDPTKTDRPKLEAALKRRGVAVAAPPAGAPGGGGAPGAVTAPGPAGTPAGAAPASGPGRRSGRGSR